MSNFNALPTDLIVKIRGFLPFFHDFDAVSRDFLAATRRHQLQNVVDSVSHLTAYQLARLVIMCAAHITAHWTAIRDDCNKYVRWNGDLQTRSVSEHISDSCELIDESMDQTYGDLMVDERDWDDINSAYCIEKVVKFSRDIFPSVILILNNLKICDRNLTTDLVEEEDCMLHKIYCACYKDFDNSLYSGATGAPLCTTEYSYWLDPSDASTDEESQIVIDAYYSSSMLSYGMLLRAQQQYPRYRKFENELETLSVRELSSRLESICRSDTSQQSRGNGYIKKVSPTRNHLITKILCSQFVHV